MSVSAAMVKELREKTNAGMMDCKKALQENGGNFEKAIEWLRKKGLSKAAKKADRIAAEGMVQSYIHGEGRIAVLVEVNSESDFVAKNDNFKEFAKDIAMHIAAMNPQYVSMEDIPEAARENERRILSDKNREQGKKEEIIPKIVEGQLKKWAAEICLLDQSFIKDSDKTVNDYLKETIARLGENIVIRRFARYELGEGLEKKQDNFAEEVAAQVKG